MVRKVTIILVVLTRLWLLVLWLQTEAWLIIQTVASGLMLQPLVVWKTMVSSMAY